jgi:hypothetical protein
MRGRPPPTHAYRAAWSSWPRRSRSRTQGTDSYSRLPRWSPQRVHATPRNWGRRGSRRIFSLASTYRATLSLNMDV